MGQPVASEATRRTRLLSHRLRGFGPVEGSLKNLEAALQAGVRLIEIDTRHTCDSQIVIYHPPCLGALTDRRGIVSAMTLEEIREARFKCDPGVGVATLDEFLARLAGEEEVELWIDVKDYGLEGEYVRRIRELGLTDRVRLISWIPQTLLRVHTLAPEVHLGLSHFCLERYAWLHACLRTFAGWTGFRSKPLFRKRDRGHWSDALAVVPHFWPLEHKGLCELPHEFWEGFNHTLLSPCLPDGLLLKVLQASDGMVGMFPHQVSRRLLRRAHELKLGIYVYSISSKGKFNRYVRSRPVDVVFCNDSRMFTSSPQVKSNCLTETRSGRTE